MKLLRIISRISAAVAVLLLSGTATAAVNSGNPALSELQIRANGSNLISFDPSTTTYTVDSADPGTVSLSAAPVASDATVSITVNSQSSATTPSPPSPKGRTRSSAS